MTTKQSRRDDTVIDSRFAVILIPKGCHDSTGICDTPSGLANLVLTFLESFHPFGVRYSSYDQDS